MAVSYSNIQGVTASLGCAALALGWAWAAPLAHSAEIATEPVGYLSTTVAGGSVRAPGLTFVSPSLVNPVLWQGQVTAVNGTQLTVSPADWQSGDFDSRHLLEVATGPYAGIWTAVVSAEGGQLTLAEPLDNILAAGDTVRIRRFTTLADFLGPNNEAGLRQGREIADADAVVVYHASGARSYWYYSGSQTTPEGWYNSSWGPSADVVIAPGEGVVLQRRGAEDLPLYQTGLVKAGQQGIVIEAGRNFVGGVISADLSLGSSQLYTGNAQSGFGGGREVATADTLVIYGARPRTYWYFDGSQTTPAGWYDSSWQASDNVVIPAGSTVVIERKRPEPFVWFVPSFAP